MNHAAAWPLLDQYLDCALDAEQRWAMTMHVSHCPSCQHYLREQARLRMVVRDRLGSVAAPSGLADRIHAALAAAAPASPPPSRRLAAFARPQWLAVALLIVVALAIFGWWVVRSASAPSPLAEDLALQHSLFGEDDDAVEVAGAPAVISAWFTEKLPFAVPAPTLPGYVLQGGRLAAANGQRAAHLIYERDRGEEYVSLFYFEPSPDQGPTEGLQAISVGGPEDLHVLIWSRGVVEIALVSQLPESHLRELAATLQ
jgi:anti-sigma factor RsiW